MYTKNWSSASFRTMRRAPSRYETRMSTSAESPRRASEGKTVASAKGRVLPTAWVVSTIKANSSPLPVSSAGGTMRQVVVIIVLPTLKTLTDTRFTRRPSEMTCMASPTFFTGMPSVMAKMDSDRASVPRAARLSGNGSSIPRSSWRQPQKKGEDRVTSSEAKTRRHSPSSRSMFRAGASVGFSSSNALTRFNTSWRSTVLPHCPRQVAAEAASSSSISS
mmetsp:Transcript_48483/g.109143  ORF Transcript_48483/g.109143 Transcript_48483/m.109143 type:complete len:220 (+) Transcript_48483:182-841(+)